MSYTPINECRLSRANQEILKQYKKMSLYAVNVIHADEEFYDALLDSISPSVRHSYKAAIPFMGKMIVKNR